MENIKKILMDKIKLLWDIEMEVMFLQVPEGVKADFATNVAMVLAKMIKRAPMEIASELMRNCNSEFSENGVSAEVVAPGFINFISRDEYFLEKMARIGDSEVELRDIISLDEYHDKQIITEFSDPNPFKVLHVGHLYTSVMGDSISRMLQFAGAKVHRVNFGGDVGMHVAKTVWAIEKHLEEFRELVEDSRINISEARAEFMAKCYVEGTRAYEDDGDEKIEIEQLNKKIFEIALMGEEVWREKLEEMNDELRRVGEIYWYGRKWSYAYFEEFYKEIGVEFEKYYPESSVAERGLKEVKNGLKKGVYEESNGAVVFSGEKYGLHTRVFINKAGLPTYEAKDVGLSFTKWDDYKFDESVIITGNDIIDYMKVVLKSISMMEPKLAERTVHITHGNVRLPGNEKMSSRLGNFLRAMDVVEEVKKSLMKRYGEVDEKNVLASIKYAFLKYKIGGNIEFNIEESVSMTGNSGPYIQYAVLRAEKILEKVEYKNYNYLDNLNVIKNWKMNDLERSLAKKICDYSEVVSGAIREKSPHKICTYLYETAQEFSRFYEKNVVVGDEFEQARAVLVMAYKKVMRSGLDLIGIEVPKAM